MFFRYNLNSRKFERHNYKKDVKKDVFVLPELPKNIAYFNNIVNVSFKLEYNFMHFYDGK